MPKKAAMPKDKPMTILVILIVSGIVGQLTRLSSCLDSCKNDEIRLITIYIVLLLKL